MLSRRVVLIISAILLAANAWSAVSSAPDELQDLAVGEALFSAFHGEWFDAITRLDKELMPRNKPDAGQAELFRKDFNQATTTLIDFELAYRMHLRDGHAILDVIENNVDDKSRNDSLFRLAKIYFQKDQPGNALLTLDRISGEVLPESVEHIAFFRAQILMASGRYRDAITILDDLIKAKSLPGFAGYNLGIAHLLSGNQVEGRQQLDLAGQITSKEEMNLSIRDKANLVLGDQLLKDGLYEQAGAVLDRVRMEGPFSSQALLSAGWIAAFKNSYNRALVPWTLLSERNVTDNAVQEAMLAVPYSYGKLSVYNKAAIFYGRAVEAFGIEIDKLTDSIASVREGRFLNAVAREEFKQKANWEVTLRELPGMPETYYLLELMASHEYQESLNNYYDLEQLRKKLTRWQQDLQAYEELVKKRRAHYEPLLPVIDAEFKKLYSRMRLRLEQRDHVGQLLTTIMSTPRADLLATAEEQNVLKEIDQVDRSLRPYHSVKTRSRIERLRGLVYWPVYASYDQRLMSTRLNFDRLDDVVANLIEQHASFVRVRRAATQSYTGYDDLIDVLRMRIKKVLKNTVSVMARQGELLENMAETELVKRREKLEEMQIKARFAMAESFDRASTTRATGGEVR